MLRVVIDPGVIIAGVISPRAAPAALLRAWRSGRWELVVSPALLRELLVVFLRPKFRRYLSQQQAYGLVIELGAAAVTVEDPEDRPAVTPDPKDDYLVALALAAKADALVSGDRDLLGLHELDVPVLTARALVDQLTAAEQDHGEGV